MPSYRVELARTGRAGCTNKECKDNKVKIPQGELRFGSWVDTERIQAFFWRHWGCVTPKIVSNIKELVGEGDDRDLDLLDGYDELPSEMQEKVVRALDQGHVDDEDWKGDPEMNEPGKSGFRVRTPRKKAAQASDKEKGEESQEEEPIKTSKPKKRSRFEVAEDEDEETRPRKPKRKSTGYPKDKPISDDNQTDGESPVPAQAKTKSSKRGRKAKDEDSAATPASKRAKKAKKQDDNDAEAEPSAEKPKRGRRKKAA